MPVDRLIHPRLIEQANQLTDFEFRVFMAYWLAADDYGVMRKSAVTLQAANDVLANRKQPLIQAALKRLVDLGIVRTFEHAGRRYIYYPDWQNRNRVKHPRETLQPAPPPDELQQCSAATRKLFANSHPALQQTSDTVADKFPQSVRSITPEVPEQKSGSGSLACARGRETANGERLTANEGVQGDPPPMDLWARELIALYPPQGRCGWILIERPLFDALMDWPDGVEVGWQALKDRLEQHKRSHQWTVKGMIPRLDRWLKEGLYLQELPEQASAAEQLAPRTLRTVAAAAAILSEPER